MAVLAHLDRPDTQTQTGLIALAQVVLVVVECLGAEALEEVLVLRSPEPLVQSVSSGPVQLELSRLLTLARHKEKRTCLQKSKTVW